MRENMGLYHGKRKDNGEWVEGFFCNETCVLPLAPITEQANIIEKGTGWWHEVILETVGEYTGLRDCKRTEEYPEGQMIFEGDIVKIAYWFGWDDEVEKDVPEVEQISKVYSIDACPFCVDIQSSDGDFSPIAWLDWIYDDVEIEVIGNIHDNLELLEVSGDE